eukprot:68019_1
MADIWSCGVIFFILFVVYEASSPNKIISRSLTPTNLKNTYYEFWDTRFEGRTEVWQRASGIRSTAWSSNRLSRACSISDSSKIGSAGSERVSGVGGGLFTGEIVPVEITVGLLKREMETNIKNAKSKFLVD